MAFVRLKSQLEHGIFVKQPHQDMSSHRKMHVVNDERHIATLGQSG